MTPDFSPAMLRLFLHGRIAFVELTEGLDAKAARKAVMRRIVAKAPHGPRLFQYHVDAALCGKLIEAKPRLAIWSALEIYPAMDTMLLTDDGGQEQHKDLAA